MAAIRRRSTAVPLFLLPVAAASIVTACTSRVAVDPCEPSTYERAPCEQAVLAHGYWFGGTWYPHIYSYPSPYYYSHYTTYVHSGGIVRAAPASSYRAGAVATPSPHVTAGGFGGIGAGHAATSSGS